MQFPKELRPLAVELAHVADEFRLNEVQFPKELQQVAPAASSLVRSPQ